MGKFALGFGFGTVVGFVAFPVVTVAVLVAVSEHNDTLQRALAKADSLLKSFDDVTDDEQPMTSADIAHQPEPPAA